MKAVQGLTRTTDLGLKGDMYKISKAMKMDDGEMAACFMKLKEIVPTVPDDKKISKMQLLQHVIDYIFDLEIALDVPSSGMSGNLRTPLSERVEPSNIQDEVCDFMEEDCIARSTAK